jgi:hypothetical protein
MVTTHPQDYPPSNVIILTFFECNDVVGILFEGYLSKWFFWQIIILARRSLLVFITVIFDQGNKAMINAIHLILKFTDIVE